MAFEPKDRRTFTVILLAGLVILTLMTVLMVGPMARGTLNSQRRSRLIEVPAKVIDASANSIGSGYDFSIEVRYEYAYGGAAFESTRWSFFDPYAPQNAPTIAQSLLRSTDVVAYVDPAEPSFAVLNTSTVNQLYTPIGFWSRVGIAALTTAAWIALVAWVAIRLVRYRASARP
ncbi:MAG: DUF3592 domain-containing protein [Phycisphaerales bacterium JB039]